MSPGTGSMWEWWNRQMQWDFKRTSRKRAGKVVMDSVQGAHSDFFLLYLAVHADSFAHLALVSGEWLISDCKTNSSLLSLLLAFLFNIMVFIISTPPSRSLVLELIQISNESLLDNNPHNSTRSLFQHNQMP